MTRLISQLKRLRTEYKAVNDAARDLQRTERAVQDQIGVAADDVASESMIYDVEKPETQD